MAELSIIDIDLGLNIDAIIAESVEELTGAARAELDLAIATAQLTQKVKNEKEQQAREADTKITTALQAAFEALVEAGPLGLPVSSVMNIVADAIKLPSAFTTRMKNFLISKGNPYYLERKKVHSTPHYVFMPYNETLPSTSLSKV